MTERQQFINALAGEIAKQRVPPEKITAYNGLLNKYYDRLCAEPKMQNVDLLLYVERISAKIIPQLNAAEEEPEPDEDADMKIAGEEYNQPPKPEEIPVPIPKVQEEKPKTVFASEEDEFLAMAQDEENTKNMNPVIIKDIADTMPTQAVDAVTVNVPKPVWEPEIKEMHTEPAIKTPVRGTAKFWGIFVLTLPLTIPLMLAVFALVALGWGVLAGLLAAGIAGMAVAAAGGAALSLVGFIYGVILLFSEATVGVYEIGLGLICAGTGMIVGILFYNFSIRLMPLIMKKAAKLMKKLFSKIGELFDDMKRRVA